MFSYFKDAHGLWRKTFCINLTADATAHRDFVNALIKSDS